MDRETKELLVGILELFAAGVTLLWGIATAIEGIAGLPETRGVGLFVVGLCIVGVSLGYFDYWSKK